MNRLTKPIVYSFSKYLQTLYQASVACQTPFFRVDSSQIQIIEDPLDFYLHLNNSITHSSQRIGLSSLYLGTGTLERHLLANMRNRHKICPNLISALVFDHHRSQREQYGQSPYNLLTKFAEEVGSKTSVGFVKIGKSKGVLGQVLGVHHQKIYIFDDRIILGGANLSKNYFLNRKDRYISINSPEMSDYLFDYLQILSEQLDPKTLNSHYKLWKYAYMPSNYLQNFRAQLASLKDIEAQREKQVTRTFVWQNKVKKDIVLTKNEQIAKSIGTSITKAEQMSRVKYTTIREQVRDRLFTVGGEDYVNNQLEQLGDPFSSAPAMTGEDVFLFPFIQWSLLNETYQYSLFKTILMNAAKEGHHIRLSSGYLNLDQSLFRELAKQSQRAPTVQLLCSSPIANSFFRGGGLKTYIPFMYRCYQYMLLKTMGQKVLIKQFENGTNALIYDFGAITRKAYGCNKHKIHTLLLQAVLISTKDRSIETAKCKCTFTQVAIS